MTQSFQQPPFNRRDFLRVAKILGGLVAFSSLIQACSGSGSDAPVETQPEVTAQGPSPTLADQPEVTKAPQSTDTPEPTATEPPVPTETVYLSQIALVKTADRAQGVRKAIDLLGINPVVGKRVFLKPNFNSAHPTPGSTHPDVLRSLVLRLMEMGADGITVGDRSGMGDTHTVMRDLGVFKLAEELGFDTVVFDDLRLKEWEIIQPPGSHWKEGFAFARPCLETGALVQTCCLKTHQFGGVFTMSLKNSVGMVAAKHRVTGYDYMQELHGSRHQRSMIAETNTAYSPALIVLDAVEAFVSGGPHTGKKVSPGVILAGTDRIAIDAVGVAILRHYGASFQGKIFEQEQIARAVELGLGVESSEGIELITADTESAAFADQIMEVLSVG